MLDVFLQIIETQLTSLPHLRDHLLGHILRHGYDGDDSPFSDAQQAEVQFHGHKLYQHKVLQVNYTTHDLRHEQDYIKLPTYPNIMVLCHDGPEPHPYWYARVIGIFHAIVDHPNLSDGTCMDFLWAWRLPQIGFVEDTSDTEASPAFSFVDPGNVIHSVYLVPIYGEGRRADLLGPSLAHSPSEGNEDFCLYYVNFFADCDLFMRFYGGGVGHSNTREASNFFLNDRYPHTQGTPAQSDTSEDDMGGVEIHCQEVQVSSGCLG
ncbi:hypothetical protein EI94DRAFT_1812784 [Lactarius quietus]|nr:hypothetical protein EI94DRAFT_1812784 [Lactarius quietus]